MQSFSYGHRLDFTNDYYVQSEGSISVLEHLEYIKDLGVTFDSKLKFAHHSLLMKKSIRIKQLKLPPSILHINTIILKDYDNIILNLY